MGYIRCGGGKVEPPVTSVIITATTVATGTVVASKSGSITVNLPFSGSTEIVGISWGPQHTDSGNIAGLIVTKIISVTPVSNARVALAQIGASEEEIEAVMSAEPGVFVEHTINEM